MICNNCKIKNICKINEIRVNNPGVVMDISSCDYKPNNSDCVTTQVKEINSQDTSRSNTSKKIEKPRKSRVNQNLRELSNQMEKEKNKNNNPVFDIINKEITQEDMLDCSSCGSKTVMVTNCPICKKEMCDNCSMVSVNDTTGRVQIICEECWVYDRDKKQDVKKENQNKQEEQEQLEFEIETKPKQEIINIV